MKRIKELPISEYQKRFFLEWIVNPESTKYNVSLVYKIKGKLNKSALKKACEKFTQDNEVFHAKYSEDGEKCFYKDYKIDDFYDEYLAESSNEKDIYKQLRSLLDRKFDLTKSVLEKFYLIKVNSNLHYFILSVAHHIVADAISAFQVVKQVGENYNCIINNVENDKKISSFIDAVQIEKKSLTDEFNKKAKDFWKRFIGDVPLNINLPYKSSINFNMANKSKDLYFSFDVRKTIQFKRIAKSYRVTPFILISAIYSLVLFKFTNQEKFLLSYPIDMRPNGFKDVTGCFVNNILLKIDFKNIEIFSELLKYISNQRKVVKKYQGYSMTHIINDQRKINTDIPQNYFNASVTQANLNVLELDLKGLEINSLDIRSGESINELGLLYDEYSSEQIKFRLSCQKELFSEEFIYQFKYMFINLIDSILENKDLNIKTYNLLSKEEYQTIVYDWNKTDKYYPRDKTIYQLFEEQVEKNPNNIALVFEGQELTYEQLNNKANQLARYIRKHYKELTNKELKPDTLIPLCLERSFDMVIGILGVMKAGGAYVPMDSEYPEERFRHILLDTNAKLVITQSYLEARLTRVVKGISLISIDSLDQEGSYIYSQEDESNLISQSRSTDLAYVIYTSGTTGLPKGVMIEHKNVIHLIYNQINLFNIIKGLKLLQFSSYVFDASISEIFRGLLSSAFLHILSNKEKGDIRKLLEYIKINKIDMATIPPVLLSSTEEHINLSKLKVLILAGETSNTKLLDSLSKVTNVINAYGPTEGTVCVTMHKYIEGDINTNIGKPLNNTKTYILDQNLQPVPIGVVGELYIGGAGLSRGYINMPELTAERFISNPFAIKSDIEKGYIKLYKTGDLVRWLDNGNIEYIGRNDDQVKIRGYRIELGEIENQLSAIEGIKHSCVLSKDKNNSKYLVGYYVADKEVLTQDEILEQLAKILPDYMIPSILVEIESMPLTINGKLDRRSLPNPEFIDKESYIAPSNVLEKKLCNIFAEVLGLEEVGITDDFFRIGGDSIISIQLSSKLRRNGIDCNVRDIFDYRTVRKLASYLGSREDVKYKIIQEQGILEGEFGLLPIQEWFFEKIHNVEFKAHNHWNQSFLVKVEELDISKFKSIIERLVSHHDILRTNYIKRNDKYLQTYRCSIDIPKLKILDIGKLSEEDIFKELTIWQSDFDIGVGPLWSIGYLYGYKDSSARLYFALHHLIVDSVSWRILVEDFKSLYNNQELPLKATSYRQYIGLVKDYADNNKSQLNYWNNILANMPSYPKVGSKPTSGKFCLNKVQTENLLQNGNKAYNTEINDLLLTGLAYSLKDINKSNIQGITLEGHGREHIAEGVDLNHTVGWFTTVYPVLLEVKEDLGTTIKYIKESLRTVPDKGIGFGSFVQVRELSFDKLPGISFNYLGQFDSQEGLWQLVSEGSGIGFNADNYDHNIININGMVVEGELSFIIMTQLGKDVTDRLINSFQNNLIKIQEHTKELLEQGREYFTPSDYNINLSLDLFDRIQTQAQELGSYIEAIYFANSLQQGFIYHMLSSPNDDAYRVQLLFDYKQELNIDNYVKSWELAIQKNPMLRTLFNWEEALIQITLNNGNLDYTYHDISNYKNKDQHIKQIQEQDRQRCFDFSKPTQLRLHIIKQSEQYYTILKSMHHIISDGWSGPILLNQVHGYYKELSQGKDIVVIKDNSYLRAQDYIQLNHRKVKEYWQSQLGEVTANDLSPLLTIKRDLNEVRSLVSYYNQTISINEGLYTQLKALKKEIGITINTLVQFVWHKLIQIYTQDTKSIVGATISGRDIPIDGIENSVGLYINTLPLIVDWDNDNTVKEQLKYLHGRISDLSNMSYMNLAKLQEHGQRLFHSLLVYENYPMPKVDRKIDKHTLQVELRQAIEKLDYPIGVTAYENSGKLYISVKSTEELISKDKMQEHLNKLQMLLEQSIMNLDSKHKDLAVLTEQEYQTIVYDWNKTDKYYPRDKTIYQLFEEQVEKNPNNIALVFEGQELTYEQLNNKANQLARYIRKHYKELTNKELKPDTLIPLCLERSFDMVIGILGVMKAGGAYVPMDSEYPEERFRHILLDTNAKLVITQSYLEARLTRVVKGISLISIDSLDQEGSYIYSQEDESNLISQSRSTDLAYVIYTSGTTGLPKGVMIEHSGLVDYLSSFSLFIGKSKKIGFLLNYCFDASVPTILLMCIKDASIYIYDVKKHIRQILVDKVDVIRLTPSMLNMMDFDEVNHEFKIILGGEELQLHKINKALKNHNLALFNQYGPTEFTVGSHIFSICSDVKHQIIGRSYSNTKTYILDQNLQPVPIGVVGELYIGGAGLSRGYINMPELTAERFISNPFATKSDIEKGYIKLYKTGDLVRWLDNGNIEYIGRNDDQVKIRGYRIELGEIENQLSAIEGIKHSCVLSKDKNNSKYLVGYYVADKEVLTQDEILEQLAKILPDYMIPSILVEIESMPLTINGKLDRRSLPNPEFIDKESYIAPSNVLEKKLCNIFAEVLGLEEVGITDDFFRIGGDSIISIQLSSKLRRNGIDCNVRDIFDYRTVRKLASYLGSREDVKYKIIQEQGILEGEFGLLPIQEWFFEKIHNVEFKAHNHWNQSFLVKVEELDISKFKSIIERLVSHHDILRTNYIKRNDKYLQTYRCSIDIPKLKILDIGKLSEEDIFKELTIWQSDFDIGVGPLWSIGYLYGYKDSSARLYFALHHLIVDSVSWRILVEDFKSLYNNQELPLKATSYRQYIGLVKDYADNNKSQLNYWNNILANMPSYPKVGSKPTSGKFCLNKVQTENLLQNGNKAYNTEINDLLLTGLAYSLKDINKSNIQGITLEGHGREHIAEGVDLNHTVGWFTTVYPVLLEVKEDLGTTIKYIKESLRTVPDKGIGFGSFVQVRELSFDKLPGISFNYLGQFDSQEGLWQLVSEGSGIGFNADNYDHNIININGMVVEGELSFIIMTQLGKDVTDRLINSFQNNLIKIQEHTKELLEQGREYFTPSDYNINLSLDLFDRIQTQAQELGSYIEAIYFANSLQQGFIYHMLSSPNDDAYRVQLLFDYKQELNIDNYVKSWELAIQKNPMLRTLFNWEEALIQITLNNGNLDYTYHDISNYKNKDQHIKQIQEQDRQRCFDFSKPTQLRLHIIKQSEQYYTILKSMHHIISDGWSGPILLNQVHGYYKELSQGKDIVVIKDNSYLRAQDYIQLNHRKVKEYWQSQLGEVTANDLSPLLTIKRDLNEVRSLVSYYNQTISINEGLYTQLKALKKEIGITINTLVQFVWHKLIQIYTQDTKSIVGATISGRDIPIDGIENSVGLYINTLPLIVDWDNDNTVKEQLKYLHGRISDLSNMSYMNLAKLQEHGQRLFHSLLVYENYPMPKVDRKIDKHTLQVELRQAIEKLDYPIGVTAYENSGKLYISVKSTEELISKDKMQEHLNKLQMLLEQSIMNLDSKHKDLAVLTEQEYQTIVYDWNKTDKYYPRDKTIYQLFEEQVEKNPNNIALVFEGQELTYEQLNNKANQLARYIRKHYKELTNKELKPDTLIPLCLERSFDMVIGILGVMKAGGAYVPMDSEYPEERFRHILLDTNAKLVITQSYLEARLTRVVKGISLISIDSLDQEGSYIYSQEDESNLISQSRSTDLAYVIYTSGTTGLPKGVMIEHKNVHRLLSATDHQFKFNSNDVWTLYHSYIFDFTVWELWGSLTYGGKLIVLNKDMARDISKFIDLCSKHKVSVLNQTPSVFYRFIDQLNHNGNSDLKSLRYVIFGGDSLNVNHLSKWWDYKNYKDLQAKLINMYGITETTVHVTYKEIVEDEIISSNIGKPLNNIKTYILDQNLQPVPIGVVGELYIGGAGLSRGYINMPELTAERFISNPFATKSDIEKGYIKLYKTGDLVRWLDNGNIEYIGRNDDQVKIRGYRIELGEIENQLSAIEGIKHSCVLSKDKNNSKYLVGYYVADKEVLTQDEILEQLAKILPDYMIPSILVEIESMPLTINGKLDRRSLPNPEFIDKESYIAPSNVLEKKLCNIFAEVLGLEEVGITDDFFRIGGDSIISIQLVGRLKKSGFNISVADIFTYRTIQKLLINVNYLQDILDNRYMPFSLITLEEKNNMLSQLDVLDSEIDDIYPVSYLQLGMLFESILNPVGIYHDVFSYKVNKEFNEEKFIKIWSKLSKKHEQLRSSFINFNEKYYNVIHKKVDIKKKLILENSLVSSIEEIVNKEKVIELSLDEGGLYRFIISNKKGSFILIYSFHHAITDGWSVASLISEFVDLYVKEEHIKQELIPCYGKFVKDELCIINNHEYRDFWFNYLKGYDYVNTSLLLDKEAISQESQIIVNKIIDSKVSIKLIKLFKELSVSIDTIFLSVYYLVLSKILNKEDLIIGTVANNRLQEENGERLFGLHLNTIPFRNKLNKFRSLRDFILNVQDNKYRLEKYKLYPYGKLKSDLSIQENLYQFAFNYIHFHIIEDNYMNNFIKSEYSHEQTNIPLSLNISRGGNNFKITLKGLNNFIDRNTAKKFIQYFNDTLNVLVSSDIFDIKTYNLLSKEEYQTIVYDWNKTDKYYPRDKTIYQLFEEQVEKNPNNIALVFEGQELTYEQLNNKANQLARYIRKHYKELTNKELKPDTLIPLCLERSFDMVIGILGVMKAGGAYVPMDSEYPEERFRHILLDTNAKLVITQSYLEARLTRVVKGISLISIDSLDQEGSYIYSQEDESNLISQSRSTDLAYVIYTSGTTGLPKGVMIEHKNVNNLVFNINTKKKDVYIFLSSSIFDASIFELFSPLLLGAKLVIVRDTKELISNINQFKFFLKKNNISIIWLTKALFDSIYTQDNKVFEKTKCLIVGGEALDVGVINKLISQTNNRPHKIINGYGPTESTTFTTLYNFKNYINSSCPIGKPLNNIKTYILDQNLQPVPIGVVGELYIGGAGLSRGYINMPELTAERFISNPFATKSDIEKGYIKLYKTGDLVRWLDNGNIEYIGRNDDQVKIRGYRIELGEIENQLSAIEGIKHSCVLSKDKNNSKYLVGYYVADKEVLTQDEILEQLAKILPDYMIPSILVEIESMPLTINGKLDRRSLPNPEFIDKESYIAPSNVLEEKLCNIFAEVLGLEEVGITDDFFRIGGNSILAIKLSHKLSKELNQQISVAAIFKYKSIMKLASIIEFIQYDEVEF